MEVDKFKGGVERIDRFQALQAGMYWRAKQRIEDENIDADEVLLVQSIRWVDDAIHTVILRTHPRKYGQSVKVYTNETRTSYSYAQKTEHRFLLADFFELFEYEPDVQKVRNQELLEVQAEVADLQKELAEFGTNQTLIGQVVEEGLQEMERKAAYESGNENKNLPALTSDVAAQAAQVATGSVANALAGGINETKIAMLRSAATHEHNVATIKAQWMADKTKKIGETINKMIPFFNETAAAAVAQTEDVRNHVAKIMKGIGSLDLYVGKDVRVDVIRKGESASPDEPLTIVQKKLCMDEELAQFFDVDAWFDFQEHDKFFDALNESEALVDVIFPTKRCVLAMATTRRHLSYGNIFSDAYLNKKNHEVFLLVRDGQNLFKVVSPVESHLGAGRLFPRLGDGDAIFRGVDGKTMKFDDLAFTDKLAVHQDHALHYKRFLILLAGLDHREKLFGEFYDERHALEFVSQDFQDRYFRFLCDDDAAVMLGGEGRPSLADWIVEKNAFLQAGSRVACYWAGLLEKETAPTLFKESYYSGKYYVNQVAQPREAVSLVTVYGVPGEFQVDVEVTRRVGLSSRDYKSKVNLSKFRYSSGDPIGFLCLDRVRPEEIDYYIRNREARQDFLSFIQLFKLVKKRLLVEQAEEADTRAKMVHALIEGNVVSADDAGVIVDEAVSTWRAANKAKPLPKFAGEMPPREWNALLDLMFNIARGEEDYVARAEAFAVRNGLSPIRLSATSDGKIALYVEPGKVEADDRLEPFAWVHRIILAFKGDVAVEKARKWVLIYKNDASETTLKEWAALDRWVDRRSVFSNPAHKAGALSAVETSVSALSWASNGVMDRGTFDQIFASWKEGFRNAHRYTRDYELPVGVQFPVGLLKKRDGLYVVYAGTEDGAALLGKFAPSEEDRESVLDVYATAYRSRVTAIERLKRKIADFVWRVEGAKNSAKKLQKYEVKDGDELCFFGKSNRVDPSLDGSLKTLMQIRRSDGDGAAWLDERLLAADGSVQSDVFFGIKRPEGFGPFHVFTVHHYDKQHKLVPLGLFSNISLNDKGLSDDKPESLKFSGSSGYKATLATMKDVMEYLNQKAEEFGMKVVPWSQIDGVPAPAEGVDRWYFVSKD